MLGVLEVPDHVDPRHQARSGREEDAQNREEALPLSELGVQVVVETRGVESRHAG